MELRHYLIPTIVLAAIHVARADDVVTSLRGADPTTYAKDVGGGVWASGQTALAGSAFSCGDVVSFLQGTSVNSSSNSTAARTLRFEHRFSADSSVTSGVGYANIERVSINVKDPDLVRFGNPPSNPVLVSTSMQGNLFKPGGQLHSVVDVQNVKPGDFIIFRFDVLLRCQASADPHGHLDVTLFSAKDMSSGKDIKLEGPATITMSDAHDARGATGPLIRVAKTVAGPGGVCGADDVETVTAHVGQTVTHCYSVNNDGTKPAFNVTLKDDNATPLTVEDDINLVLPGLVDAQGTGEKKDLSSGAQISIERREVLSGAARNDVSTATLLAHSSSGQLVSQDDSTVIVDATAATPTPVPTSCRCSTETVQPYSSPGKCQDEVEPGLCVMRACMPPGGGGTRYRDKCDLAGTSMCDLVSKPSLKCDIAINVTHCDCSYTDVLVPVRRRR